MRRNIAQAQSTRRHRTSLEGLDGSIDIVVNFNLALVDLVDASLRSKQERIVFDLPNYTDSFDA